MGAKISGVLVDEFLDELRTGRSNFTRGRRGISDEKGGVPAKGVEHSIGEPGHDPGNTPGLSAARDNRQQRTLASVYGWRRHQGEIMFAHRWQISRNFKRGEVSGTIAKGGCSEIRSLY